MEPEDVIKGKALSVCCNAHILPIEFDENGEPTGWMCVACSQECEVKKPDDAN